MKNWLAKFLHRPQRMTRNELLYRIDYDRTRYGQLAYYRNKQGHERARGLYRMAIELDKLSDALRSEYIDAHEAALKWRELIPKKRPIEIV